jgi:NADH-quinone oxidoreductase subunit M
MHTRDIAFYGGLVNRMPWYAATFLLFTMGNIGLPGTSGFVGEILTMTGVYGGGPNQAVGTWTVLFAATGVILSAVYALSLYRRVVLGTITNPKLETITDMNWREVAIFAPLIVGALALGVFPHFVLGVTGASVDRLVDAWRLATSSGA